MASLLPSGFRGFSGDLDAFGLGHRLQAALAADLTAFAPDGRHILGNIRGPDSRGSFRNFRFWWGNLACRDGDRPRGELIRVTRTLALRNHTAMMPQSGMLKRALWKSKLAHYRASLEGKHCHQTRCTQRVEFFEQMYRIITNGVVWHGEIKNRAKYGSTYWTDATVVPFTGLDGKPRQYIA